MFLGIVVRVGDDQLMTSRALKDLREKGGISSQVSVMVCFWFAGGPRVRRVICGVFSSICLRPHFSMLTGDSGEGL